MHTGKRPTISKSEARISPRRYSQFIKSVLASDFRYLVNLVQYKANELFSGPPRNIPNELVLQLFGKLGVAEGMLLIIIATGCLFCC